MVLNWKHYAEATVTRATVPQLLVRPNLAHGIGSHIHPPLGLDVLVELLNQFTLTGQMSRIDSLGHVRIPSSPAQVPSSCRAMRNLFELTSHTSVKPRELALIPFVMPQPGKTAKTHSTR
jgi:hypothetical protein